MAKSLVGEDSAPPQATAPLAYVTADRGARSPAPPPLSSFCSRSPPPSRSPSLPSTKKALEESNQGFDSQTQYIVTNYDPPKVVRCVCVLGGGHKMKFSEPKQNELNFAGTE